MKELESLLHEIATRLNLPYTPGLNGGGVRVLVGLWALLMIMQETKAAERVAKFIEKKADLVDGKLCSIAHDPLAVLLGDCPLTDYDQWRRSVTPLSMGLFNPYFLALIKRHLAIVVDTCIANDVKAKLPLDDPTLIKRLWQQIVPLTVVCTKPNLASPPWSEEGVRKNALIQQEEFQENFSSRINNNWDASEIERRDGGPRTLRRLYELLAVSDPTPITSKVSRWQHGLSAGHGHDSGAKSLSHGSSFGKEDIRIVSHEGDIGAGHFLDLVKKANTTPNELGSAAFQLMVAGFVYPSDIRNITTKAIECHVVIETPLLKSAEYEGWDEFLLLPKGAPFRRVVPAELFHRCVHLAEGMPTAHILNAATLFLKSIAGYIEIKMIGRFLAHQAPLWYGLPRTFAAFGFANEGKPMADGGWIDYARHEPSFAVRHAWRYFEAIGLDYNSLAEASKYLASCGSGGVAREDTVREMFSILLSRLNTTFILGSSEEDWTLSLAKWDGTVGLYALALQALCFRRPYQFHFPDRSFNSREIEHEKIGPRKISLSPIAINLSKLIHRQWVALKSQAPKEWLQKWPRVNACAAFLSLPRSGVIPMPSPVVSAQAIAHGLTHDSELTKFAGIYPGFPRHTADYALRIAGLTESEIDLLTDHASDRARARISKHTLDGPALPGLHARGEQAVAKYLGLAK